MPIMDGFEATEKLLKLIQERAIEGPCLPSIIGLTAYSTEVFTNKCLASGMESVILKPITAEQLRELLTDKQLF